jgi:hypothetical protein
MRVPASGPFLCVVDFKTEELASDYSADMRRVMGHWRKRNPTGPSSKRSFWVVARVSSAGRDARGTVDAWARLISIDSATRRTNVSSVLPCFEWRK